MFLLLGWNLTGSAAKVHERISINVCAERAASKKSLPREKPRLGRT